MLPLPLLLLLLLLLLLGFQKCAARKRVRRGFLSSAGLGDTAEWLDFVRRTSESSEETKHGFFEK